MASILSVIGRPGQGLLKNGPAPLEYDGRVIDTAESAHLKATHISAHSAATAKASHGGYAGIGAGHGAGYGAAAYGAGASYGASYGAGYSGCYGKWTDPQAHIQLTHDGQYVGDTPEVQHARAAYFAQFTHAADTAASALEEPWDAHSNGAHGWH
ncbi:jg16462 [Pararge aegeria aegeria]|uniref:Jg16462 protein n=1 Tax=Pararge aegeria aegeria TaxID=348720 RepID=A0A8S4RKU8_9NEOP|nr:jg16462 [Pararge aegeria aegeria]